MNCQCSTHQCSRKRDKLVTLTFQRDQLLYDIRNYSWVEGDVLETENPHQRHQIQDIGEDGNINRVTRILDLAFEEAADFLFPYTKKIFNRLTPPEEETETPETPQPDVIEDDILRETEIYYLELKVPETFSITTVHYLERLIHEYLVYRVLEDWLSITDTKASAKWAEKCEATKKKIEEAMNARTGRTRLTLTPW